MKRAGLRWVAMLALGMAWACGGAETADESAPAPEESAPAATPEPAPESSSEPAATPDPDPAPTTDPLLDPDHPESNATAPAQFRVAFETTKGRFVVEVHRDWAPHGADRFYNLVRNGYYDGNRFFRVVDGFVAQFGMNGDPAVNEAWDMAAIPDDPDNEMNTRGRITFAHGGPETRTTQLFINLGDNLNLDTMGFPPFGEVVEGMEVVESLHADYGDGPPYGMGPDQGRIGQDGNDYLDREYPLLDAIESATIVAER